MNKTDSTSVCKATRHLIEHLEAHENDSGLQSKREDLIESAWRVFESTANDLLSGRSPKEPNDVIHLASEQAQEFLRDHILSPPWLELENQHEKLGIREHIRKHLKPLRFGGGLIDASVSLPRILIAEVVGGLYGLVFFPYLLWPAHLDPQTLFLVSILTGSILFSAAIILVNTHWKAVLTSVKAAAGATAIGILGFFLVKYAFVGWFGAISQTLQKIMATRTGSTLKEKVHGLRERAGGWLGFILLIILLPILLLLLSRPKSRMRTGDAKEQFRVAAETWLDHAILLVTSLEESVLSHQYSEEPSLDVEMVSSLTMKGVIEAAHELKEASSLEEYRFGTERLRAALGYSDKEQVDADGGFLPPGVKVFSREPTFVIYWEKRLEALYRPFGTLAEGQIVEIMQEPLCRSDGTVLERGEVRRFNNV